MEKKIRKYTESWDEKIKNKKDEILKLQKEIELNEDKITGFTEKIGGVAENAATVLSLCTNLQGNAMSGFASAAQLTSVFVQMNDTLEILVTGDTSKTITNTVYKEG